MQTLLRFYRKKKTIFNTFQESLLLWLTRQDASLQLPYLIQPFLDFLHVGLVGGAFGVDPLGNLIDVPADGRQGLVHLFISRFGMFSRVSPSGQNLRGYKHF